MRGYLLSGVTLGLAAGLAPGPMLALVVAQTLRYGWREGVKVSLAPLVTDAPIVAATVLVLARLKQVEAALGGLAVAGGLYLGWLGLELIRRPDPPAGIEVAPGSLRKAVTVNFLNPHVYLFWMTVGGPLVIEGASAGWSRAAAFVAAFYFCLCGSKVVLALAADRIRGPAGSTAYGIVLRLVGLALAGLGLWLIWGGLARFGFGR